jgi:hypothetical protein
VIVAANRVRSHVNWERSQQERPQASLSVISWPLVYALSGLQVVVTIAWMAYADFQPKLLEGFALTALASPLAIYLGLTGSILAPLVGSLSDRVARRSGDRIPVIASGGLLAGATFVAVASTAIAQPVGVLRYVLVGLIGLWVAAMTVLQAPALSLLPQSASSRDWPLVASPLVVATVLPAALWPFVRQSLDRLGGPSVFVATGVVLVIATLALRRVSTVPTATAPANRGVALRGLSGARIARWVVAFALGVVSAVVTLLASTVVPGILAGSLGSGDAARGLLRAVPLGASALLAPSLARFAVASGKWTALGASVVTAVLCAAAAPLCGSVFAAVIVALLIGGALAVYLDSALPVAFELLPSDAFGLAAGLYLGGAFAGSRLLFAVAARF